jgi:hypothetical protein
MIKAMTQKASATALEKMDKAICPFWRSFGRPVPEQVLVCSNHQIGRDCSAENWTISLPIATLEARPSRNRSR